MLCFTPQPKWHPPHLSLLWHSIHHWSLISSRIHTLTHMILYLPILNPNDIRLIYRSSGIPFNTEVSSLQEFIPRFIWSSTFQFSTQMTSASFIAPQAFHSTLKSHLFKNSYPDSYDPLPSNSQPKWHLPHLSLLRPSIQHWSLISSRIHTPTHMILYLPILNLNNIRLNSYSAQSDLWQSESSN